MSKTPQDTHPYPCLDLKTRFFYILMFTSDFIWIILRQLKNKKKYRRHNIDVKFFAESIPTVRISIYIGLHLEILDFLLIFDFPVSPYFVLLFWVQISILREIVHGIAFWIFFPIFMLIWINSGNSLWKWCKSFYRKIEKSPSIFFQFSNLICIDSKIFQKNFQDTISRVKFPVESKSELGMGVRNKAEPGNQKKKNRKSRISRWRPIYIDILTVRMDSAENFTSILCLRYFFQIFTCLSIIKIKSEIRIKISKKPVF